MKLSVCLLLAGSLVWTWPVAASEQAAPAVPGQPGASAQNKKTAGQPVGPKKRAASAKRKRTAATARNQGVAAPHNQAPCGRSTAPEAVPAPTLAAVPAGNPFRSHDGAGRGERQQPGQRLRRQPGSGRECAARLSPAASATAAVGVFAPIPVNGAAAAGRARQHASSRPSAGRFRSIAGGRPSPRPHQPLRAERPAGSLRAKSDHGPVGQPGGGAASSTGANTPPPKTQPRPPPSLCTPRPGARLVIGRQISSGVT